MEKRYPDAVTIAKEMKDGAQASPWVPLGVAPRERYHILPDGLSLCLTLDTITEELADVASRIVRSAVRVKPGSMWHLSIARTDGSRPTEEESDFWCKAFFEEEPFIVLPSSAGPVKSKHFFWRIKTP
jgi:hypothetical protein